MIYQEQLRREFNAYGDQRKAGILSEIEWESFIDGYYDPRLDGIADEIHHLRMQVIAADL